MTQDGEASAAGPPPLGSESCQGKTGAESPAEQVEQEEMEVLLQERQNFPSLCPSSHPSDLDQRQSRRSSDSIAGSFQSDTKTRAKNIVVAPEGAEERRQAGEPALARI